MKQFLKRIAQAPYKMLANEKQKPTRDSFQLFKYSMSDGSFDYEKYKRVQTAGNKCKLDWTWAIEENIKFLSNYILAKVPKPAFGLCHGTRRGNEQQWFAKYLGCSVVGTEISDTATQFPNTIQWDFHDAKEEWINSVDFIYSNSLDHSYDPKLCLNTWMTCLRKGGVCLIEHTPAHVDATELDPFGASLHIMPYLILAWSEGRFCVKQILEAPGAPPNVAYVKYLVLEHNV